MMQDSIAKEAERWADTLATEFEDDVKKHMSWLGDQPLFAQPMTEDEKRQKATEVWDDVNYWMELISTYGLRNAVKASTEMIALLQGQGNQNGVY